MSDLDAEFVKLTLLSDDEVVSIVIKASEDEEKENEKDSLESIVKDSSKNSHSADEQSPMLLLRIRARITRFLSPRYQLFKNIFLVALFVAYMVYYGFAMAYSVSSATALTVFTSLGILLIVLNWVSDHYGPQIKGIALRPLKHPLLQRHWHSIRWLLGTAILAATLFYVFLFTIKTLRQVRCFFGVIFFLLFTYLTSKRPDKVRWSFVGIGLFAQFVIGVIVIRWSAGFTAFNFIFRDIRYLLFHYPLTGTKVVYGPLFFLHPIAMFLSSVLIYAGSLILILYSLTRAVRLVRYAKRWLPLSTDSQLHLCLVSTHAILSSIALANLTLTGVSAHHVVTGMAMCVPAAVAFSLISFPETQKSTFSFKNQAIRDARPRPASNIFLMGYQGSLIAAKIVGLIFSNILAFASMRALFDSIYSWLAGRLGIETNITGTLGYAFMPFVYLIGVRWEECYVVGCLVAEKIFGLNLHAFGQLGYKISLNELQNDTAVIATHALLGFSLFGTLCAYMGLFRAIAPRHGPRMFSMFPRVILNVNVVCFYTASVAVILSPESIYEIPSTMTGDQLLVLWVFKSLPSYKDLMAIINQ